MKISKTLFLSMLAIAVFASCSKTEEHPGLNSEKGEATQATFTINVAETGATKASSTNEGLLGESTIETVNLYIFNKDNVLEDIKHITIVDRNATFTIETTTGLKTIYAVVNQSEDMPSEVNYGYSLDKFEELTVDATRISRTGAFTMIGSVVKPLTATSGETPANVLNIDVSRMVAKVVMRYDDTQVDVDDLISRHGKFENASFLVVQTPNRSYLSPRDLPYLPTYFGNNELTNGNGGGDITQSPTDKATFGHLTDIDTIGIKPVAFGTTWNDDYANSCYTAENVNLTPTTGNTTFALVRLQYKMGTAVNDDVYAEFDENGRLHDIHSERIDVDVDASFNVDHYLVKYENGYCYYRLNINDNTKLTDYFGKEKYNVLRNKLYQIDITMVSGLGSNTFIDLGPTLAPGPNTLILQSVEIEATVKVLPWTVIDMPSVLN